MADINTILNNFFDNLVVTYQYVWLLWCIYFFAFFYIFVSIRKVAKKVFIGNLQPDETVDASNEANLLKHLNHPAIVKFYDSFIEANFFYIITEYCEVTEIVFFFGFHSLCIVFYWKRDDATLLMAPD